MTPDDITDDSFLGGRLRLLQPKRGYRAGLDALLLAAAVSPGARLMEAGCGVGAALLAVALRHPEAALVGVEREPAIAALARENIQRNGLDGRVQALEGDALAETGGGYDGVFCNPPYDDGRLGRAPAAARLHAHVTEYSLDHWVARLADRMTGGGMLTMIHRADRLDALLAAMEGRLGGVSVRPLHPKPDAPAHRVLIRAIKGSRAPLSLLPGVTLHEADGGFTAEADAWFRGEGAIGWG